MTTTHATHTQGRWATNRGGVEGPNGEPICGGQFNESKGVTLEQCNANMRLIAAAPDLLAALKGLITICEMTGEPSMWMDEDKETYEKCWAAVKKAENGTA